MGVDGTGVRILINSEGKVITDHPPVQVVKIVVVVTVERVH